MTTPQQVLRNACLAAADKAHSAPQPYGKIVHDMSIFEEGGAGEALRHPVLMLEVIARLLEAAHAAAGEN